MRLVPLLVVAIATALLGLACPSPSPDTKTDGGASASADTGSPASDAGALPVLDAGAGLTCAGSLSAAVTNISSSNVTTSAFASTQVQVIDVAGAMRVAGTDGTGSREVTAIFAKLPSSVGETFPLTASLVIGSEQASLLYDEASNGTIVDRNWVSQSGTLTVTAITSCFISFKFSDVGMTEPAGPDAGSSANQATGTFTLNGTATNAWTPCGMLTASFTGSSGASANTSDLSVTGPKAGDTDYFFFDGTAVDLLQPMAPSREVHGQVFAPVAVGQAYSLSSSASLGSPGSAILYYVQSDGECWIATGGTLLVSSLQSCVLNLTVTGATMTPLVSDNTHPFCQMGNSAAGTFTMTVTGTGVAVSQ